jgi:thiamine biosynthesis lipoprotein
LNLGAIGKGYALDRVAGDIRAAGVDHALLSAGRSSLLAVGGRGRGWHVDVVTPACADDGPQANGDRRLARVWLTDAALGTSGAGAQFVDVNGTRYGHVIDPRTGWPASGVRSASVAAPTAAVADALSTAFLIGGVDMARDYCASHPDIVAIITPEIGATDVCGEAPGVTVQV